MYDLAARLMVWDLELLLDLKLLRPKTLKIFFYTFKIVFTLKKLSLTRCEVRVNILVLIRLQLIIYGQKYSWIDKNIVGFRLFIVSNYLKNIYLKGAARGLFIVPFINKTHSLSSHFIVSLSLKMLFKC